MSNDIEKLAQSSLKQAGVHSTVINGNTYSVTLLPATQALAVGTQLFKICLPALGAYLDGTKKAGMILPEEDTMFQGVSLLLVGQLDKVSVLDLVTVITKDIKSNGNVINVDEEFKGNLGGFVALLEFALKENCGSFFTDYLQAKGIDLPSLKDLIAPPQVVTDSE